MNTTTITVGSVTYAIKVRKLFERAGIRSNLIKADISKKSNGCVYGIKISSEFFYDAIAILKKHGIQYSVYSDYDIPR